MSKKGDSIQVPIQYSRALIDTTSYNAEDNTVEVVFATETPVKRYSYNIGGYFYEVLEISEKSIDFLRLHNGASILNTHNTWDLKSVLGVVVDAWVDASKKEARAKVKLSEEEEDKTTVNKIIKGIIRNISCSYDISEYTLTEPDNEIPTLRATKWMPLEISFVPVPADPNSGTRNQDKIFSETTIIKNRKQMEPETTTEQAPATPQPAATTAPAQPAITQVDENAVRSAATQEERNRVTTITDSCKRAGLPTKFAEDLIANGTDIHAAREAMIEEISKRSNPAPITQRTEVTGEDEAVKQRNAIIDGIMERSNPGSVDIKDNETARRYANMRLLDIAKDRLRTKDQNIDLLSEHDIVKRAWATTDYPDLLTATFERSLRRFYEGTVEEWRMFARRESLADFREKTGITVDGAVTFEEIPEGGVYRETPIITNDQQKIKLAKFGRKYSITDIAIINDDLGVFSRIPQILAIGAQQFQSEAVWGLINSNAKAPDGTAMFHTSHKNLASSGAVINETTLSTARTAMRRQTSPAGHRLGIRPKYLLVPPELETAADKMVSAIMATVTGDVNVFANKLQVVVSDMLSSDKSWYTVADPAMTTIDGLVYAYLNGEEGLKTDSRINWDNDSLEVKGSLAFACAVWGYQGWYKNPGA